MALRELPFTDDDGRAWVVMLPELEPDSAAARGVRVGPPDTSELGLPLEAELRLRRELIARGLVRPQDLRGRGAELQASLMAALRLDAQRLEALYRAP